jgi:hypothetical protein
MKQDLASIAEHAIDQRLLDLEFGRLQPHMRLLKRKRRSDSQTESG